MLNEQDLKTIHTLSKKNPDFSKLMDKIKEEQRFCLSKISHEVRNPVTLINSSLQLIEQQHPEVKTFAFWKETMEDLSFLRTLLDELSSFNNGDILHPESKDLSEWIPHFITTTKSSPAFSNICLEMSENLPTVIWDFTKVRQVLHNLIRNSWEASPKNSVLLFKVSFEDPFIQISIQDHGCGIPESIHTTLFEPFQTTKSNGTGLGLAICKKIVESHHGTISVFSQPKKGTTVTIRVPSSPCNV